MENELKLDYYFNTILYRKSEKFDGYLEMLFQNNGKPGVFFDGLEVFFGEQMIDFKFDYGKFQDITDIIEKPTTPLFHLSKVTEGFTEEYKFHIEGHGILDVKSVLDFDEEITQRILFIPFEKNIGKN